MNSPVSFAEALPANARLASSDDQHRRARHPLELPLLSHISLLLLLDGLGYRLLESLVMPRRDQPRWRLAPFLFFLWALGHLT